MKAKFFLLSDYDKYLFVLLMLLSLFHTFEKKITANTWTTKTNKCKIERKMNKNVNEKEKTIIKLTHSSSYGIVVWYRERNDNVYCSEIALVESNIEEITMEKRKNQKKKKQ